jgi:hypothetical protein
MIDVVVSRYKKDTSFAHRLSEVAPVNVMEYDKERPENPYNVPVNRGTEASVYLKHIVDNYDDRLSEWTFFIHDEERSWHHRGTIAERFKEAIESGEKFYNINNQYFYEIDRQVCLQDRPYLWSFYKEYIDEFIPRNKLPCGDDFFAGGKYKISAQFLVHKSLILALPKRFYERLYEFTLTPHPKGYRFPGFLLEWTWHVFWGIYPEFRHLFP